MTHTHKRRNDHSPHHKPRDPKSNAAKRRRASSDTEEHLDPDTLTEMMQLLERVQDHDLPPKEIVLIHHVPRPRPTPPYATPPGCPKVTLRYEPAPPHHGPTADITGITEEEWKDTDPPTN